MTTSATVSEARTLVTVDGKQIRRLREQRGVTQLDLAIEADMMQAAISRLESGRTQRVRWSTLERLAKALGESTERLVKR